MWIVVRKWPQQQCVGDSEDGRVGSNAQGKSENGCGCESRIPAQHAGAETEVAKECFHDARNYRSGRTISCGAPQNPHARLTHSCLLCASFFFGINTSRFTRTWLRVNIACPGRGCTLSRTITGW